MAFVAWFGVFGPPEFVILSVTFAVLLVGFQMPRMVVQILQALQRLRINRRFQSTYQAIHQNQENVETVELKQKILIKQLFIIIGATLAVIALLNLLQ